MIEGRASKWFVSLALSLGVLSVGALSGCPKKSESDSSKKEEVTKDKDDKKKGDDDDDDSAGYKDGDVLEHISQKCAAGRIYVNLGAISKDPVVKPTFKKLDDKIAESMKGKDGEKFEAAMKALADADIDPGKDVREIAMCLVAKKNIVLAVGGDFAGKDPLAALQKAAVAAEEEKPKKKEVDGVSYLQTEKVAIGLVTPNVIVFSEDVDVFGELAKKQKVSDDWNAGENRLMAFAVKGVEKGIDVVATFTDEGKEVKAQASIEVSGPDAAKMKSDPKGFAKGIKEFVVKSADKLDGTPLSSIADDLRDVKVKVDGNVVTMTATISDKHMALALKKLMDSSEQELEDAFK
jgi:hypothetical protein